MGHVSYSPLLLEATVKKPEQPIDYYYQGLYSYPVFELQAFSSNNVWKDPAFSYEVVHAKGIENPGVDYLYAYWLARYAGVGDVD